MLVCIENKEHAAISSLSLSLSLPESLDDSQPPPPAELHDAVPATPGPPQERSQHLDLVLGGLASGSKVDGALSHVIIT